MKVYVVRRHYWMHNCGEPDWYEDLIDSIWSRMDYAKRRVNDLANEFVRKQWYDQGCNLEDFICKSEWAEDGLSVTMSMDPYKEETYYVEQYELNMVLKDFEGL